MAAAVVAVEIARAVTVLLGIYTLARVWVFRRRALRRPNLRAACDSAQKAFLWLVSATWAAAAAGILTRSAPSAGAIFYPLVWLGWAYTLQWVNRRYIDYNNKDE